MSKWKGQSKGNATGYKIFVFLIDKLGLGFAYFILHFVAFYFFLFSKKEKSYIKWYFLNIQGFSPQKSLKYVYKSFYSMGVTLLDKITFFSGAKVKFTFDYDGEEHMHQLAAKNTGAIIVGAHIGNWEVAGQLMERIDVKVNIVMKLNENEAIKEVIENSMVLKKMNIINITDELSYLIEIKKALDNNEFVILHGDRFVDDSNIIEMDFMGKKADFPMGPFILALKFRKPILFAFAMKESRNHYHFYSTAPIYNEKRTDPKDLKIATQKLIKKYIQNLEPMLLKYPEQWYNYYKFWN